MVFTGQQRLQIIKKLEEELSLEEDMKLPITLLAPGLADKMGKQDNKLKTLSGHFAKIGGHKMQGIKIWAL